MKDFSEGCAADEVFIDGGTDASAVVEGVVTAFFHVTVVVDMMELIDGEVVVDEEVFVDVETVLVDRIDADCESVEGLPVINILVLGAVNLVFFKLVQKRI
ncbi:hypothetical protein NDU88_002533 [Pleurodeles waltl]|uniref:Uncharacterized protein n=1 Tax=Pleurodeles waltl TaxID=8319 RepID=A0AAV7RFL9_PLEWA|nr:hypothetical protein NDU88_002533 [Pleurodeles waltl]